MIVSGTMRILYWLYYAWFTLDPAFDPAFGTIASCALLFG